MGAVHRLKNSVTRRFSRRNFFKLTNLLSFDIAKLAPGDTEKQSKKMFGGLRCRYNADNQMDIAIMIMAINRMSFHILNNPRRAVRRAGARPNAPTYDFLSVVSSRHRSSSLGANHSLLAETFSVLIINLLHTLLPLYVIIFRSEL